MTDPFNAMENIDAANQAAKETAKLFDKYFNCLK